jgi:hypothetical protein
MYDTKSNGVLFATQLKIGPSVAKGKSRRRPARAGPPGPGHRDRSGSRAGA